MAGTVGVDRGISTQKESRTDAFASAMEALDSAAKKLEWLRCRLQGPVVPGKETVERDRPLGTGLSVEGIMSEGHAAIRAQAQRISDCVASMEDMLL